MAVFCKGLIRQVNGQKWPVLEVNFKHCKFKTDNGLSIVLLVLEQSWICSVQKAAGERPRSQEMRRYPQVAKITWA